MRCDVNVSLWNDEVVGDRVEVKNVNGTRFVQKAIELEMVRQAKILNSGQKVPKETRRYNMQDNSTIRMRSKEDAPDYRFIVDPDLPTIRITYSRIDSIKENMPELPLLKKLKMAEKYQMSIHDVQTIYNHRETVELFESFCEDETQKRDPRQVFNWFYVRLYGNCEKKDLSFTEVIEKRFDRGEKLKDLIDLESEGKISTMNCKAIMYEIIDGDNRSV
jgi:aspartyl-tRNA(Asn)/glutamyl-tRNA(Gln) amidotransferase subunit B